jgi:cytidine deaminase
MMSQSIKLEHNAELLDAAKRAADKSYSPYSKLRVGAVIYSRDGKAYMGCNIENPSFAATLCAERSALAALIVSEGEKAKIATIAIWCSGDNPCYPCGVCRQALVPFIDGNTILALEEADGSPMEMPLLELLPNAFKGF